MAYARNVFVAVMVSVALIGCASKQAEFEVFAQAGSGYAAAVDELLVAAGEAQINSTSINMVVEKSTTGMDDASYQKLNNEDIARLQQIARLRKHAKLLGQYFGMLEKLATSDAPGKTKTAIDGVVTELEKIQEGFPGKDLGLSEIGKVALDMKIKKALRDELNNRKTTIRRHLELQKQLLEELGGQIQHALALSQESREQMYVIDPLVSEDPLKKPEDWIAVRKRILFAPMTVEELSNAAGTALKLRQAFEGLITGEMTLARLNRLITDIEGLLSIIETVKS